MPERDNDPLWYHGSQKALTELRVGSSITQNRNLAKAFSHRPTIVCMSDRSEAVSFKSMVKHNGVTPGYLYTVTENIDPSDIYPHPHPANADGWEWLTRRELKLQFIGKTIVTDRERLTEAEVADAMRKQKERGEETFVEWSG